MEDNTDKQRRVYGVKAAFESPLEIDITVAALSVEHARQLVTEQFQGRQNFRIVDIFDLEDVHVPDNIDELVPPETLDKGRLN